MPSIELPSVHTTPIHTTPRRSIIFANQRHGDSAISAGGSQCNSSVIKIGTLGAAGDPQSGTQGGSGVKIAAIPGVKDVGDIIYEADSEAGDGGPSQGRDFPSLTGQAGGTDAPVTVKDPLLLVEYCVTWLPADLSRLPELDLGEGLMRPLHCYAHGGFMGAAISMLADPQVRLKLLNC